jgi:hypothetical protein
MVHIRLVIALARAAHAPRGIYCGVATSACGPGNLAATHKQTRTLPLPIAATPLPFPHTTTAEKLMTLPPFLTTAVRFRSNLVQGRTH